jgi:hypothetical protein
MARNALVPPRTDDEIERRRFYQSVARIINHLVSSIPDDSTASDVAGVVADLNSLQDAIKDISAQ